MASGAQRRRDRRFAQALRETDPVARDRHLAAAETALIQTLNGQPNNAYGDPTQDPQEAHLVSARIQVPPEQNPECEEYWRAGELALQGSYQTGHGWPTDVDPSAGV